MKSLLFLVLSPALAALAALAVLVQALVVLLCVVVKINVSGRGMGLLGRRQLIIVQILQRDVQIFRVTVMSLMKHPQRLGQHTTVIATVTQLAALKPVALGNGDQMYTLKVNLSGY